MAYVAPPTHNPGDLITASDWNQYIRDNWGSLTNLVAYTSAGSALSGWTEYTAARGLFIVALVSGGVNLGTVGTALTNQQDVTHTHSVPSGGWSTAYFPPPSANGHLHVYGTGDDVYASSPDVTSGTASAGSIGIPYIQMMCIAKS